MKSALGRIALPLFVVLAGCGGGAQSKPANPSGPGTVTTATPGDPGGNALVTGEAMPALTPASAPPGLVAVGRVRNPGQLLDSVQAMSGGRFDWRALLRREGMDAALMPEASVDVVVALDPAAPKDAPKPLVAVTVPLKSVEAALAASHKKADRIGPGVYGMADDDHCRVAASLGTAPARLVCAEHVADLDALLPYATRGLPTEQLGGGDVHVELRFASAREMYGSQLRQLRTLGLAALLNEVQLGDARFDRALEEAARAVADEVFVWVEDLDVVTLDATLDRGSGGLALTSEVRLKSDRSFLAQLGLEASSRGKGAPDQFWKIPREAYTATYGRSASAAKFAGVRKSLVELSNAALTKFGAPVSARTRLADVIDQTLSLEGTTVFAQGRVPGPPGASAGASGSLEEIQRRIGWYLVGGDFAVSKHKALLDGVVKLYQDPALRADLKKRYGMDSAKAPAVRAHATKGVKGGTTYEVSMSNKDLGLKTPGSTTIVAIVIVADGTGSWLALARDEASAADKVAIALKGGNGLVDVPGMALVKAQTTSSGGFFNPLIALADTLSQTGNTEVAAKIGSAPHQGATPIPFSATVTRESGVTYRWAMTVPKAAIEDLIYIGANVPKRTFGI